MRFGLLLYDRFIDNDDDELNLIKEYNQLIK